MDTRELKGRQLAATKKIKQNASGLWLECVAQSRRRTFGGACDELPNSIHDG